MIINSCMKTYTCANCNKENIWKRSTQNKYCDNKCQSDHTRKTKTIPRIERGECTNNSRTVLKRYLVQQYGEYCSSCGIDSFWNGDKLTLQLDHIDGNSDNNFPENLRLLCPNCHSQTETFGSKGMGNRYKKDSKRNTYLRKYKGYVE